jgi:hypothetical protein
MKTIFVVLLAFIVWVGYREYKENQVAYVADLPSLDISLIKSFASLRDPPRSVVTLGKTNYGTFHSPVQNINLEATSPISWLNSKLLNDMRLKRWEYHAISNSKFIMSFHIVNAGYVAQASLYFYDRVTGIKYQYSDESPLGFALQNWTISQNGDRLISWKSGVNSMRFEYNYGDRMFDITVNVMASGKLIKGIFQMNKIDPSAQELSVIFPHTPAHAAYTHKSSPLKLIGYLRFDNVPLDLSDCVGSSDFTYSHEKRRTTWTWSSMAGKTNEKKTILINFTSQERFLEYENVIWVNDKLYRVGEISFVQPTDNQGKWIITSKDGKVKMTFEPLKTQAIDLNYLIVHTKYLQSFGVYSGTFVHDGTIHTIENVLGVSENHYAKW